MRCWTESGGIGTGNFRLLCEQGYEYLPIHSEAELIANLRQKLEELNGYTFTKAVE